MTKERPILFSGAMVRAILEGRKTQTRRVFKDTAEDYDDDGHPVVRFIRGGKETLERAKCPYGKPGDRLWVRESFWKEGNYVRYMADGRHTSEYARWKPSIHMPRAACRLVLEVTEVRVERLHDISAGDCYSEGIEEWLEDINNLPVYSDGTPAKYNSIKQAFEWLWRKINGHKSWEENPWVWVVSFRKVTP